MAAALRKANPRNPVVTAPRNECSTHKARSVKLAEANKENFLEPVRPEKRATKHSSRLPVPVEKFKVKSVPDFKKLHQSWDRNFQKKQMAAKKACTQPVPFNFATSRGAKSVRPVSTNQTIGENTLVLSSTITKEEPPEPKESYPVGAKCVVAGTDPAAVETKPIKKQDSGELLLQEKRDFDLSLSSLKIDWSVAVKKEKHFGPWQTSPTSSKSKNSDVQNSAQEIKQSSPVKEKMEILQNAIIKPKAGSSDGEFVGNPMALQSILSNLGIDAFNIINDKPSLANAVSVIKNIQNPEPSNPNPGNKGMALGNALSTVDDRNTFGILCGKSNMIIQAPAKDTVLHCKYSAQNPFVIGRSSYMPCNRPAFPLALGRASCIAKLVTKASEISSPNRILQPLKLYNQVSSRHHFSSKKSSRHKPDGPDSNLVEEASESLNCVARALVSAGAPCTWKPDAKTLDMQTPDGALRPSHHLFSSTRTPSENLWHPSRTLAPLSSVVANYKYVKWSDVRPVKGNARESSASENAKDPMDQIVLRLFNDADDPNEVEKVPETPSLKEEMEGPKSQESPALMDLKLEKLKKIELLAQLLQKEIREVKVIEETLTESSSDASVPILPEVCPNLNGAILKSSPIVTASEQQEAEGCVLPSDSTELTANQTPILVDCSIKINGVCGAADHLCTVDHQSEISLPSTELPLNVKNMLHTPGSHSSACSLTTAQGLKFQSPFCIGNTGRGTLQSTGMKRRFGEIRPECRAHFQEMLLDEEVSCCFAHVILSPDGRRERSCTNPVAKTLDQQEVMHFVPIELPPCITSQKSLQQFLLSVQEEQGSPAL